MDITLQVRAAERRARVRDPPKRLFVGMSVAVVRAAAHQNGLRRYRAEQSFAGGVIVPVIAHLQHVRVKNDPCVQQVGLLGKLHVSRQTMTGILDKLETGGYALRVPHETDRRRKVIRLTDKGTKIVSAFVGRVFRREAALFERHPEVNVDKTLDELDRMLSLEEAWTNEYPLQGEGKSGVEEES